MNPDPWKNTALRNAQERSAINGGHSIGIQIGSDLYYWADEVHTDDYGKLHWTCQYPDHVRKGARGPEGEVIMKYEV